MERVLYFEHDHAHRSAPPEAVGPQQHPGHGDRAITVAFFGTAVLSFGYGFVENAGAPRLSMFAVWPLMGTLWIVGRFVAPRMP